MAVAVAAPAVPEELVEGVEDDEPTLGPVPLALTVPVHVEVLTPVLLLQVPLSAEVLNVMSAHCGWGMSGVRDSNFV